jgi:hypothetical protein
MRVPPIVVRFALRPMLSLGITLFRSIGNLRVICGLAWLAHCGEAFYAWRLCKRAQASRTVTVGYVLLTFIGGFTQLGPLKSEVTRLGMERDRRMQ